MNGWRIMLLLGALLGAGADALAARYNAIGKVDYRVDKLGRTTQFVYDARENSRGHIS